MNFFSAIMGRFQTANTALPVNLGSYDYAKNAQANARIQSIDQAMVWVVVALLMWGMVMVYSASIAMPDNPRFGNYAQNHFLLRHIAAIGVALVAAALILARPILPGVI